MIPVACRILHRVIFKWCRVLQCCGINTGKISVLQDKEIPNILSTAMSCGTLLLNRQCGSTSHWDQCLPVAPEMPEKLTPCRRACPSRQVNKPTDENHITSHQMQLWIFRLEIRWQRSKAATSLTHQSRDHPVEISEMNAVVLSDYWLAWTSFSSSYLHCSLLQLSKQFNNT